MDSARFRRRSTSQSGRFFLSADHQPLAGSDVLEYEWVNGRGERANLRIDLPKAPYQATDPGYGR